MNPTDLRLLCTALGFTTVMGHESALNAERQLRITSAARAIEAFCINNVPEAIHRAGNQPKHMKRVHLLANAIERIMRRTGECTKNDLVTAGFRAAEVKRHWRLAYGLACSQLDTTDV